MAMGKRIVFCADGTWEAPVANTNVYRLYKALTVSADQVTYYDDGVGADTSGLAHLLQGALGTGLLQKVQDGYTKIAHVYEPGDEIYLFGFSRGAYTVRSLGGMIKACGLPVGTPTDPCIAQAMSAYRNPAGRAGILAGMTGCGLVPATIRMIGVWDTVGSLGIPAIFGGIEIQDQFLDTTLHPDVASAYQCLAIDEKRPQFPATLWTPPFAATQTVEQVWFSGCHCDVGGGTPQGGPADQGTRLCDITLGWMMARAQEQGLVFDPATASLMVMLPQQAAMDAINESLPPGLLPRLRPIGADASVANSVGVRVQYVADYRPANLKYGDVGLAGYGMVTVVNEDVL
jgi:uncharacterized protein (DUF2235 family)